MKDETKNPYEVPDWVKQVFSQEIKSQPISDIQFSGKDSQIVSYARTEASLAAANLKFLTDPAQIRLEKDRLAENLLIIGKIDAALDYAQSSELIERIKKVKKGLDTPDDQFCNCKDDETRATRNPIPISRFRVIQRVYSPRHGTMVDVKECTRCGFVNVTNEKTKTEDQIAQKISGAKEDESDEKVFQ